MRTSTGKSMNIILRSDTNFGLIHLTHKNARSESQEKKVYNLGKDITAIYKKQMSIFNIQSEHETFYKLEQLLFEKLAELRYLKLTPQEKLQEEEELKRRQQAPRRGERNFATSRYQKNQKKSKQQSKCN
jgi:septum formation inhibitor MinC